MDRLPGTRDATLADRLGHSQISSPTRRKQRDERLGKWKSEMEKQRLLHEQFLDERREYLRLKRDMLILVLRRNEIVSCRKTKSLLTTKKRGSVKYIPRLIPNATAWGLGAIIAKGILGGIQS